MVNSSNYFSRENNLKYCGSSQFKSFLKCPAMAMAEINGEWVREESTALLVGSYIDAFFEGTLEVFKAEHPDIFKRDGSLKSEFIKAEEIISRITQDELFMRYMSGKKQVIKTGEIGGVPFKIKIDSYHEGKALVDLKIIKDFEPIWNDENGAKEDFIHYWGYDYQAAIYQAIEGNRLPFYLAVATKEAYTDFDIIHIPQDWIDSAMAIISHHIDMIGAYKRGEIEAPRCEKCAYCRTTKKLSRIKSADELLV